MEGLPKIKAEDVEKAKHEDDPGDFLSLLTDKYFEMLDENSEMMRAFNGSQHTLLAFYYLYGEVNDGGFIQLVHHGYGAYIFDSPFVETIKSWGADEIAKVVEAAKIIYNKYKEKLEAEISLKELGGLYKEITDFEPLENGFDEIMDRESEKIKKYIEAHINEFAEII
jgi:hypothetical protein